MEGCLIWALRMGRVSRGGKRKNPTFCLGESLWSCGPGVCCSASALLVKMPMEMTVGCRPQEKEAGSWGQQVLGTDPSAAP